MQLGKWGLVVVDLQRYYIEKQANFVAYFEHLHHGATHYVSHRCRNLVIPNLVETLVPVRKVGRPVIYLKLCGTRPDRSDLHRHFQKVYREALDEGFPDLYPLAHEPLAEVVPEVAPQTGDLVIDKTTYSGFTSSDIELELRKLGLDTLVMAGLATSQCVETTARDASDRGFRIIHLEDAQADYHEVTHQASLFASRAVCGGHVLSCQEFTQLLGQA